MTYFCFLAPSRPHWVPVPKAGPSCDAASADKEAARRRLRSVLGGPGAPKATRALPAPLSLLRLSQVLTQTHSCLLLLFPLLDPAPARRAEAPPTRRGKGAGA